METVDLDDLSELGRQESSKRQTVWGRLNTSDDSQRHVLDIFARSKQFLTLSNEILMRVIPILASNSRPTTDSIYYQFSGEKNGDDLAEAVWRYARLYASL